LKSEKGSMFLLDSVKSVYTLAIKLN